ncbi:helix-turn-helix domain-containing protein [Cryobacterium cryoconiti]|uniref:DNA-binding protein n=1 Tax=Cryobacterium cryoconiti TaxID=1259239 RepID=A0A4Y8JX23_9MICO|nr:helix-turn-helix domain-containing protein [Cryobacterium cryoconiti]TFD33211.1 DNA-binding protein [Cryobacterium cryoconiti]
MPFTNVHGRRFGVDSPKFKSLWGWRLGTSTGLGFEPVLTTSELAEYLGVQVQAIYDLRTDGRGPSGI